MKASLSTLFILLTVTSMTHAFMFSPVAHHISQYDGFASETTKFVSSRNISFLRANCRRQITLQQSSMDEETDPSNTINIAIFSNEDEAFQSALSEHPFCKMTGVSLSIDWIATTEKSSWTKSELEIVCNTDIACFSTVSSVKTYLSKLDNHLNVDPELPQEERRKLPNKPDMVADMMGGDGSSLMAACPSTETARECLNSGRWLANNIYYPKDNEAVELKTRSLEEGEEDDVNNDTEICVEVWASSVMQAAGDVMERKFWGGGW